MAYGVVRARILSSYGLLTYHGHQSFSTSRSIAPYKIIYVLLGGLAIVVGICVLIWLPDSPVHAHFLTKEERIAALERVRDDQGGTENKHFKKEQVTFYWRFPAAL